MATSQGASKYAWLFDNTYECINYGCNKEDSSNYGYWTSTPVTGLSNRVWNGDRFGSLDYTSVDNSNNSGVRPVITVSKKSLEPYKEEILNGADPVIKNELIPVTIADDVTVTKADVAKEWYKYENKKWANAVILTDTGKIEEDGTIKEENIKEYYV